MKSFSGTLTTEYRVIEVSQVKSDSAETEKIKEKRDMENKIPLKEEDLLVCYGNYRNFKKFWEATK